MTADSPIAITLGDPNGLGPELACRVLSLVPAAYVSRPLLLIGPEMALQAHAKRRGVAPFWTVLDNPRDIAVVPAGVYLHEPAGLDHYSFSPGTTDPQAGRAAGLSLDLACDLALDHTVSALVTLPLHKAMLKAGGFDFPGHTEFLARRAGLGPHEVCMHMAGSTLRVSLATTHPPLWEVPRLITEERLLLCLSLTWELMQKLGHTAPIAVCGLNPHAGEDGTIGREEIEVIVPAIARAVEQGIPAQGPFPGDSIFHRVVAGEFSSVLAMYHDQGLAPLKVLHFATGINVTLGLPFVRASVDHGTGFDITGTDSADTTSFLAAMDAAVRLTAA